MNILPTTHSQDEAAGANYQLYYCGLLEAQVELVDASPAKEYRQQPGNHSVLLGAHHALKSAADPAGAGGRRSTVDGHSIAALRLEIHTHSPVGTGLVFPFRPDEAISVSVIPRD